MGLFDFLKSDKHKAHDADAQAKEQQGGQRAAAASPAADAAAATRAVAERMAAAAPPKPGAHASHTPTPSSAAHKAVPAAPKPAGTPPRPVAATSTQSGAAHTPTPSSAAHKAVPAAPMRKAAPVAARRTYTVVAGESLAEIARRQLGNEGRWRELYALNKAVIGSNPDLIRPGMVLTLPS